MGDEVGFNLALGVHEDAQGRFQRERAVDRWAAVGAAPAVTHDRRSARAVAHSQRGWGGGLLLYAARCGPRTSNPARATASRLAPLPGGCATATASRITDIPGVTEDHEALW